MTIPTKPTKKPKLQNKQLGKPESHSDVVNKQPKCLLIGYGWVGQFIHKYFTEANYTDSSGEVYMPNGDNIKGYLLMGAQPKWDIAFINVPTPMNPSGQCDTSIVEKSVEKWKSQVDLFVIRSTVSPGTTDRLAKKYNVDIVMQPEYVGETLGHPLIKPNRETFIILGGKKKATAKAAHYWSLVLHANTKIRQVDGLTAEFCKYMENCFLATKVIFVNDWARLCEKTGVDFLTLREAWLDDPRINRSHTFAYKDNPGFSGKCLPKDLNAITYWARLMGQPLELVEAVLKINAKMRKGVKTSIPLLPED